MSEAAGPRPLVRRMSGRDPGERHRTTTPLELLFDLTFVIAVARLAGELRDALEQGHAGHALASYAMVFFVLWWSWVNIAWFASAYDTDDVPYRLLTVVQMAGVLVFAAGIPAAFQHADFFMIVIGYVIIRMALVPQFLRAARSHPDGRAATLRYAAGITTVQLCSIGWLALSGPARLAGFVVLVAGELAVPAWAQFGARGTPWHPGHIAQRYRGFTIIVLGEAISAIAAAVDGTVTGRRPSPSVLTIAAAGLLLVFALWWSYFKQHPAREIRQSLPWAYVWGLAHYLIFASLAALGAGLEVAIESLTHGARVTPAFAAFAVAIPVAIDVAVLTLLAARINATSAALRLTPLIIAAVLSVAAATPLLTLPAATVIMVVLVAGLLSYHLLQGRPPRASRDQGR